MDKGRMGICGGGRECDQVDGRECGYVKTVDTWTTWRERDVDGMNRDGIDIRRYIEETY